MSVVLTELTDEQMAEKREREVGWFTECRFREVYISPYLLLDLCKVGNPLDAECIEGLPADAILYQSHYDQSRDLLVMVVASSEFAPTTYGNRPVQTVTFRRAENRR